MNTEKTKAIREAIRAKWEAFRKILQKETPPAAETTPEAVSETLPETAAKTETETTMETVPETIPETSSKTLPEEGKTSPDLQKWLALLRKHAKEIAAVAALFAVTLLVCGLQAARMKGESPVLTFGAQSPENTAAVRLSVTSRAVSAKISGSEKAEVEADAIQEAYVTSLGTLNVREAPSTESEIVGRFGFKDVVSLTGEAVDGFYPVTGIDEETETEISGYCYAEYLSFEAPPESYIYLSVPSYKQFDERWKDIRLGAYETMHSAGCTTTCLAMVESYLDKKTITPAGMAESISYTRDGELTFSSDYTHYRGEDALALTYQKLWEGIPVLYSQINPSGTAHWVVVVGYTGDGETFHEGDFLINDPGSDVRYTLADFAAEYPRFNKIVFHN